MPEKEVACTKDGICVTDLTDLPWLDSKMWDCQAESVEWTPEEGWTASISIPGMGRDDYQDYPIQDVWGDKANRPPMRD